MNDSVASGLLVLHRMVAVSQHTVQSSAFMSGVGGAVKTVSCYVVPQGVVALRTTTSI